MTKLLNILEQSIKNIIYNMFIGILKIEVFYYTILVMVFGYHY